MVRAELGGGNRDAAVDLLERLKTRLVVSLIVMFMNDIYCCPFYTEVIRRLFTTELAESCQIIRLSFYNRHVA
jgi:hypothetical protein